MLSCFSRVRPEAKSPSSPQSARTRVAPQVAKVGDAALVNVQGMVDEHFPGFGDLSDARVVVLDLEGVTFMTSFGVRRWLKSMAAVPETVEHLYLMNCPTIVVDQLKMILNFGGKGKLISLAAPFACTSCGAGSKETIDVLAEGAGILSNGQLAARACRKCGGAVTLDDNIDSYFACLKKYGATSVDPAAAQLVANAGALKKVAVKPSIRAATAAVAGVAVPPAVTVAAPKKSVVPVIALVMLLLAIAIGVYVLVGPS